jgi:O-acetyl-ADP-ribose deacetylase (regulator of RNase III)
MCKAVIHTVGPKMGEGNEDYKLRKAVRSSLLLASEKGLIISMPAISSGIFGLHKERCAKILVEESKTFLQGNDDPDGGNSRNNNNSASTLHLIEFCIFNNNTLNYFKNQANGIIMTGEKIKKRQLMIEYKKFAVYDMKLDI